MKQSKNSISFDFDQHQHFQTPNYCHHNTENTERRSNIGVSRFWRGRSRLRRKSAGFRQATKMHYCIQSVWSISLDLNVAYYVFWSLILFLKLLYNCFVWDVQAIITTKRGTFKVEFINCKSIHSWLLLIAVL